MGTWPICLPTLYSHFLFVNVLSKKGGRSLITKVVQLAHSLNLDPLYDAPPQAPREPTTCSAAYLKGLEPQECHPLPIPPTNHLLPRPWSGWGPERAPQVISWGSSVPVALWDCSSLRDPASLMQLLAFCCLNFLVPSLEDFSHHPPSCEGYNVETGKSWV